MRLQQPNRQRKPLFIYETHCIKPSKIIHLFIQNTKRNKILIYLWNCSRAVVPIKCTPNTWATNICVLKFHPCTQSLHAQTIKQSLRYPNHKIPIRCFSIKLKCRIFRNIASITIILDTGKYTGCNRKFETLLFGLAILSKLRNYQNRVW